MKGFVYVCVGSTGEYSDHREWYVKAFASREKCERFVEDVSAAYRVACPTGDERSYAQTLVNPLDPDMVVDYTGTNYYMVTVVFDGEE